MDPKCLKMLPSLKHSKYVDELLDLFLVQAHCSEAKRIYKIVSVRYKLIDSCSVIDKQAYIEIMELFFKRNQKHREHWNTIMSAAGKSPKSQSGSSPASMSALSTPSGKPFGNENDPAKIFKDTVKTIPSLQGTDELIDEVVYISAKREGRENVSHP
ncbi:hypothetical protein BC830DRAFT_351226 [Chytriomyces sp. MP71]|nr:hypothetical protein BC830DRAFT_351226 [Chytriomyces sp. MP71]